MSCIKFTLDNGIQDATKAFNGAIIKYLNSEDKSISALALNYIKSLKDTGLYELTDQSELTALSSFFETRLEAVSSKKLAEDLKEKIISLYKTELAKFFNNPEETINDENLTQKVMEIKENTPISELNTEKSSLGYKMENLYEGMSTLKEYAMVEFKSSVINASLVDFKRGKLVKNTRDLNENIAEYKNSLAKTLSEFITSIDINAKLSLDPNIFKDGRPDLEALHNILQQASDTFKGIDSYSLKNAYLSKSSNPKSKLLVDAYNAYALLSEDNFDSTLKNILGENLKIKGIYFGSEVPVDTLKYSFENNAHYKKSWGSNEAIDALSETSDISRILIEHTPMLNYITGLPMSNSYLTLKAFNGAMSKLTNEENFEAFGRYGLGQKLKDYAINFHSSPNTYLKLILEEILGNLDSRNSGVFSISDLNIYRSIYERFYSSSPNSLYSIINADYNATKVGTSYSLLESIAGVVDRTKTISYTQYIVDRDTNDVRSTRLKQYNDTSKRVRTINNIEIIAQSMTPSSRMELLNKYHVESINNVSGDVSIYLKYKGIDFPVKISKGKMMGSDNSKISDYISEPNIEKLRDYYERDVPVTFTPEEKLYISILEFVDDFANTGFLKGNIDKLEAFKSTFEVSTKAPKERQLAYLTNSLSELANKIAFADLIYMDAAENNSPLKNVLKKYPYYYDNIGTREEKFFYDLENNAIKIVNKNNLSIIENLVKAEQIVSGEVYKSVTKNLEGNGVANNGIFNLAGQSVHNIHHFDMNSKDSSVSDNIFVNNPDMILGTSNKAEASNRQEVKKNASKFSFSEIGYSSILYDFYGKLLNKEKGKEGMDIVDIQPTVYSDKTSFVLWSLNIGSPVKLNGNDVKISSASYSQLNDLIKQSVGGYFKKVFNSVLSDYKNVYRGELTDLFLNNAKLDSAFISKIVSLREKAIKENESIASKNAKNLSENKPIEPLKDVVDYLDMDDFKTLMSVTKGSTYATWSYNKGVPNIENVHTVKNGDFLAPNSLLVYQATKMFGNEEVYNKVMLREAKKFVKSMLDNNVLFPLTYADNTSNTVLKDAMDMYMTEQEKESWIDSKTDRLILAKDANGLPLTRMSALSPSWVRNGETITMNPLLKRFFLTDYLLSENLRLITTGSAIAHPNKSKYIHPETGAAVNPLSDLGIEMELSSRELAQLKRNVIIPATLKYFQQNTFTGIPSKYKLAVIQDVKAPVYNYKGKNDSVEAHDGSAWVNPIMSALENLSLQDASVGDDKKPIAHSYKNKYGTAVLLKFATFSMYNERMRNSQLSRINQLSLFQKMTGQDWNTYYKPGIDLTIGIFGQTLTLQDMSKNERVFYRNGNKHYEILSLNKEAGQDLYSTTIQEVDINGNKVDGSVTNTSPQVVNSVFGVHQILGGVFSEKLNNLNELEYGDDSIQITANYVNNIGTFNGQEGEALTQSNTYQPLKHNMIAYLVNKSAIKVGAENINSASAWFDKDPNTPLMTMEMDTEGLGIQMDADHHANDSEMTEFSQVISSLEANGYTHDIAKLAYRDLGRVALTSIENESNAVRTLLETDNKSDLYEIIGKAMVAEWRKDPGNLKLTQAILKRVDEEFKKKNIDHIDDLYKVPFSDPSVFAKSISSLSSYINKTAIKRKYAGMGAVMVPAYDIIQFFRFNGENMSYDDLYNIASNEGITPEEYLMKLQEQENSNMKSIDLIEPGDFVKIYTDEGEPVIATNESGESFPAEYNVDDYATYSTVKDTYNKPGYKFVHIVSKPRNLRPARIYWKDSTGMQHNIFDTLAVRTAFKEITKKTSSQAALPYHYNIQKTFEALNDGYMPLTSALQEEYNSDKIMFVKKYGMKNINLYFDEYGNAIGELPDTISIPIYDLHNEAAELVLSKLYADKFNVTNNDSVSKILKEGPQFFRDRYDKYHTPKVQSYDMVFTRGNGKHTYISFETPTDLSLKNVVLEDIIKESDYIYRTNEDGKKLYPIQKWIKESQTWEDLVEIKQVVNSGTSEEVLIVKDPEVLSSIFSSDRYDGVEFSESANQDILEQFFDVEMSKEHKNRMIESISALFEGRTSYADFWNSYKYLQNKTKDENSNKKFISFKKSLDYTVARIPAQTMQSFMKMKAVGFTSSDKNIVHVSHWQTWLQGSDYDIDKAYTMGNEFDSNGFYIGWSPLFRYESIEALNACETFTTPNGKRTIFFAGGLDITPYLLKINKLNWNIADPETIREVGKLLQFIDDNSEDSIIRVSYDETIVDKENAKFVVNELVNNHNLYKIKGREAVSAYKNSVSSRITQIIQNLKNMNGAYSPIEMRAPSRAAEQSSSGKEASTITLQNPGSKFTMQVQNMDGKSVIAIAATGEKIFFANSYYYNEGLRSGDPQWINNMRFSSMFNGIQTISEVKDGKTVISKVPTNRGILANVNFNGNAAEKLRWTSILSNNVSTLSEEEKIRIVNEQLGLSEDQSLTISALLSAATDNAKELILSKINAGTNLAGMYLHLIMLGFNFGDIATFMTSPTVQLINDLMKSNMFNEYSTVNRVDDAIDILELGPNIFRYLSRAKLENIVNKMAPSDDKWKGFMNRLNHGRLNSFLSKRKMPYLSGRTDSDIAFNRFAEEYNYILSKKLSNDFNQSVFDEFKRIYTDSKETTHAGQLYGVNQGLRTDMVGKLRFINNAENALIEREKLYSDGATPSATKILASKPYYTIGQIEQIIDKAASLEITEGRFSFKKFLNNLEYREATIEYYDLIKAQWNIFDMIMRVPHFKALYEIMRVDDIMNSSSSNKYKLINRVRDELVRNDPDKGRIISDAQLRGLEDYVDNLMIMNWLDKNIYSFKIEPGGQYFNASGVLETATSTETFTLNTSEGRATFKLWMEQKIIPELKSGKVDGKVLNSLFSNSFVQDLQMNRRKERTGYQVEYAKLPIDLMDIKTETDEATLERYKEGFQRLSKIKLQDMALSDYFFLYNLIVNKNKYGSDRLTPLFNSLLESGIESSLILDYQKTIGNSDYLNADTDINFSLTDALISIAPMVRSKYESNSEFIKLWNPDTRKYDLYRNGSYAEIVKQTPELQRIYHNYFTITSNDYNYTLSSLNINGEESDLVLVDKLKRLIERNTLNIVVNCD